MAKMSDAQRRYNHSQKGKAALAAYEKTPAGKAARRRSNLYQKYGMREHEYLEMLERQGGGCALCGRTKNLTVDHDHVTGKIRGILCTIHNSSLGKLGDNEAGLLRALEYIRGQNG